MFERTATIKLGQNRGTPRIWLEGKWLAQAGFTPDTPITVNLRYGRVTVQLAEDGKRKVCSRRDNPVVDLELKELDTVLSGAETLVVVARPGKIEICPSRIARKRLFRFKNGLEGSIFSGGGMLTQAAKASGYIPVFATEWDPDYAEIYSANHPEAKMHNMCVSELDPFSLPHVELLTLGIPCEPYSNNRTVERGGAGKRSRELPPESHELGDLVFWALKEIDAVNPYHAVIEEVPGFLAAGAGFVLQHALRRMGYYVDAKILDPTDYGCLTGRKRAVILASQEPVAWPEPQPVRLTMADILEPEDSPNVEWFDRSTKSWLFDHWDKQTAKGNGFASHQMGYEDRCVGTITKRYFAQQGDNPVVKHPTKEGVLRWLTLTEVKRLHGIPDGYYLGESKTRAGEVIGQGVVVTLFEQIIAALHGTVTLEAVA